MGPNNGAGGAEATTGVVELEQLKAGGVLFSLASNTPSIPWHRMEWPAVHKLGLIILTLFRKKLLLPLLFT